jgi:uncharacterized protein YecE (DUF72 family)
MGAAQRLAFYASRLPLVEVTTTYRFPPTAEVARRWAATTPDGFTMDVQAWSLLTGAPTWPESLWPDLRGEVRPSRRPGTKLYRHRLPGPVLDECWSRFVHALRPLQGAGRMGAVVLRYPAWFAPRPQSWAELAELAYHLDGLPGAVELTNDRWFAGDQCERTLSFLEGVGLGFVCRDLPPPRRPVVAATSEWAFVRLPGRRRPGEAGPEADGTWWSYRYSDAELGEWVPRVLELAGGTSQVHLVMDNCWRGDGVDNAAGLLSLLAGAACDSGGPPGGGAVTGATGR